jgi:hypothetical protein
MATISKGIKLFYGEVELTNLQEIPTLGGSAESIEITTLADAAHTYTNGILNYGDSLDFKFLYEKTQFTTLNGDDEVSDWSVELPDGAKCSFTGTHSVSLDGVGVNAALTYTLSVKPNSAMVWA